MTFLFLQYCTEVCSTFVDLHMVVLMIGQGHPASGSCSDIGDGD